MVAGLLHPAIQSPAPFVGASFWGPLQSAPGGWPPRRSISTASLRLCASESCARRDAGQQGESASLSLEQLHSLSNEQEKASGLAPDRSINGRTWASERERA